MAWFNFVKNRKRKNLIRGLINDKIVDVLAEKEPELLEKIVNMIDPTLERQQLPFHEEVHVEELHKVDKAVVEEKSEEPVGTDKSSAQPTGETERDDKEEPSSGDKVKPVNVNFKFTKDSTEVLPQQQENSQKVKDTVKVEIPNENGTKTEIFVWDEADEKEFEQHEYEMLKNTTIKVNANSTKNLRVVVMGAKEDESPEVRAYYETLKGFGKMIVDEEEVTVLKSYDAFFFVSDEERDLTEKQLELANNAKKLYVVYLNGRTALTVPFKREYTLLVPFKAVEKYDSLMSRVDFLTDYTKLNFSNKKCIKNVIYINTLSLLNNNAQLVITKTIRERKPRVTVLTDYVYVNNYHEKIDYPLNKMSKNLDITVYGKGDLVAPAVTFKNAVTYYSAPIYMEHYASIVHFVAFDSSVLQKADPALMTYAEAGKPLMFASPNSPEVKEYLGLISPRSDDRILTKDELFERFGNGVVQLKEILG